MITVISGTNRPDNNSIKIANYVCNELIARGEEVGLIDLKELPDDFGFSDVFNNTSESFSELVNQKIVPASRFVLVIPEYNGSFPGVLKTFMDAIPPRYFHDKKAALIGVSSGNAGNLRGLDHMTGVLHYLKMEVMSRKPKLSRIESLINSTELVNEKAKEQLDEFLLRFLSF